MTDTYETPTPLPTAALTESEAMAKAIEWSKAEGIEIGDDLTKQLMVENKARELLGVPPVEADSNWRDKMPPGAPPGFLDDCLGVVSIHMVRTPNSTAVVISDSSGCQGANMTVVGHRIAWLINSHFDEVLQLATNLMANQLDAQQAANDQGAAVVSTVGLVGPDGNPIQ